MLDRAAQVQPEQAQHRALGNHEALGDAPDEGLARVLREPQGAEPLVHDRHGLAELPAGRCEHQDLGQLIEQALVVDRGVVGLHIGAQHEAVRRRLLPDQTERTAALAPPWPLTWA